MFHKRLRKRTIPFFLFMMTAGVGLIITVSRYQRNPILVQFGPILTSALIFAFFVSLFFLDWAAFGLNRLMLGGWSVFMCGLGLFAAATITNAMMPENPVSGWLKKWSFLGLILILSGAGLRFQPIIDRWILRAKIFSERALLVLALGLMFWSLIPVFRSGFYWDDAMFSVQIPALRINGGSILERTWNEIISYALRGRINPFATFQFLMFYLFPSSVLYKALLVLLSLINAFLFYRFVATFQGGRIEAILSVMVLTVCIQLRIYHDPMTGYYGLMQTMFAELMLSLFFLIRYLENGKKRFLFLSLLFFTVGLMTYEMFYPMLLPLLLVIWKYRSRLRSRLTVALPFLIVESGLLGLSMILRTAYAAGGDVYDGTAFSINFPKIIETWWNQSLAAFPLSYRLADYDASIRGRLVFTDQIFEQLPLEIFRGMRWTDGFAGILFFFVLLSLLHRLKIGHQSWHVWAFGPLLLVCSGIIISLSQKYQFEIQPGIAYLPVWFGYFAAAWLLVSVLTWLSNKIKQEQARSSWTILITVFFTAIFLLNQQTSRNVVDRLNESFDYPRRVGEAALKSGLINEAGVHESTLITNQADYLWESGWTSEDDRGDFYSLFSGRTVETFSPVQYFSAHGLLESSEKVNPDEAFVVQYTGDRFNGLAKIGRLIVTGLDATAETLEDPVVRDVFFFYYGKQAQSLTVTWTGWNGQGHQLPLKDAWQLRETAEGVLYKLDFPNALHFDSVGITRYQSDE